MKGTTSMLRRSLQVTAKAAFILAASSAFVAAHAATTPLLSQEAWKTCEDNNPWVKSGYCERNSAWNKARCLCPGENFGGGPGPVPEIASNEPDDNCGFPSRDTSKFNKQKTFNTFSFGVGGKPGGFGGFSKFSK
jgi:hypothetical protein